MSALDARVCLSLWLPQVNLLVLLEQAAQGMAYTHTRHVVHGDLNVSLVKGGGEGVAWRWLRYVLLTQ